MTKREAEKEEAERGRHFALGVAYGLGFSALLCISAMFAKDICRMLVGQSDREMDGSFLYLAVPLVVGMWFMARIGKGKS